jgi:hypothetical protein
MSTMSITRVIFPIGINYVNLTVSEVRVSALWNDLFNMALFLISQKGIDHLNIRWQQVGNT